jgi:hypothetical protein
MYNISSLTSSKPCTVFSLRFPPFFFAICIKIYLDFQFCDLATTFCVLYLRLPIAIYLSKILLSMSASLHFSTYVCHSLLHCTAPYNFQFPNSQSQPCLPTTLTQVTSIYTQFFPHPCFTFPSKARHCLSFCVCLIV